MRARTRYSLVIFGLLLIVYLMLWDTIARPLFEAQASDLYGGEVSVDRVQMSVWQGKATLFNIQVADRSNPMRNLAEAQRVYIDIHLMKLLAKNIVDVESMEIEGLTVFSDRDRPAEILRPLVDPDSDLARAGLPDFDIPDLDGLIAEGQALLEADLQALEGRFKQAEAKWRPRMAELPTPEEVAGLRSQLAALEQAYDDGEPGTEVAEQAREVQAQVNAHLNRVDTMHREIRADFRGLQAALEEAEQIPQRHTMTMLRRLGLSPDQTAQLGNEMLRGEFSGVLQQVLAPIVYSAAGEIDQEKTPIYIEQASISGPLLNPARDLQVSGELRHFAWPLENAAEVATLDLAGQGSGGGIVRINARVDHRGKVEDDIVVSIQNLEMANVQLEGDEELALELTSARATIEGGIKVRGDVLSGDIHQEFHEAHFSAQPAPDAREAAHLIAAMLENNTDYRLDMNFSGTPASPVLRFQSDMDQQFRETIEAAVAEEVARMTSAIQARATSEAGPRVAQARQVIAELRELEATLTSSLGELDQMSR